jgi:DNA-binding NarL/FixJ family response regulator
MIIRCLIIDRNPIFSEKLGKIIEGFRDDFQVQTVTAIDEAIEALVSTDFNLVLCEPSLADLDTGLVSCIMDKKPAVSLIITGQDDSPAQKELTQYSCVKGFITRPIVRPADLAGKVVLALDSLFFQGNVREVNSITLIQILEQECSDCTLRILNTKEKKEGLFFIKQGVLLDAHCGTASALEAVKRVFSWKSVDVELYNICPLKEKNIDVDMPKLILECANEQQSGEGPTSADGDQAPAQSRSKSVGGLAGLYLKKAKKK